MYQLNVRGMRRERRHELPEGSGNVGRLSAHRNETRRSETRLRVVRAPGGFAFVEDKTSATEGS
jgi:hypothetical protein